MHGQQSEWKDKEVCRAYVACRPDVVEHDAWYPAQIRASREQSTGAADLLSERNAQTTVQR